MNKLNLKNLKEVIEEYALRSKYFEKDFFPFDSIKTKEGRFELLALSILDVRGFNADKLWYIVGKKLRQRKILNIGYLIRNSELTISKELNKAEYKRAKPILYVSLNYLKDLQ